MPDGEDVKRNVRWYQTILARACGYVDVPTNGNHNDSPTRSAFRDFQQSHGLEASGFLTVESNIALNAGRPRVDLSPEPSDQDWKGE